MEAFTRRLCGQYHATRWGSINTYVECNNDGISLEMPHETRIIRYHDIQKINSMKAYLHPGRFICLWLSSGEYMVLHIYSDKLFEEWITTNNQSVVIDHFRIPFWAMVPFILWILSAIIWAGFTMQATAENYGWIWSFVWAALVTHTFFIPVLIWITYLVVRLFPQAKRNSILLWLWLIPIIGIGVVSLRIMACYAYLRDRK